MIRLSWIALMFGMVSCGGEVSEDLENPADECRRAEVPGCAACDGYAQSIGDDPACLACKAACIDAGCGFASPVAYPASEQRFCIIGCNPDEGQFCPNRYRCYALKTEGSDMLSGCFREDLF